MPSRRPPLPPEAARRRLALLGEELSAVRSGGAQIEPASYPASPGEPPEPPEPPGLPRPGRHAARSVLPETLDGSARMGGTQLVVLLFLVTLAVAVLAWWTIRSDSSGTAVPAAPAPSVAGLVTAAPGTDAASVPSATASVVVDVAGAVRRPGIVVLAAGARVVDAIEAAGGARPNADLGSLNRARLLVDGEQIVVGRPGRPAPAGAGFPSSDPATLVNLNTATPEELETLPGVGPVTATAIVDWRSAHGGFSSVEELLEVDGIGDATLADLTPLVTV